MITNKLSLEDYNQTFQSPMQDVTSTAEQIVDIWPYVDVIPAIDLDGFEIMDVVYVYLNPNGLFEHVFIGTQDKNVFLVIIINTSELKIQGHYLLNLVEMYSLTEE
ncbi:hypothetical protein GCM10011375_24710 [Hymenobacter qilianensis]|uniref:Uncharacterized protein n=2 Tax=Hymenobacter qilianensis TaxID=1385715 RepID=A0ACB5PSX1_9BACT|nr:hypothetical protein [Hymenobacter qilianensis]QNP52562.1 hypothetical protein H9L05_01960 [Hymenobacter qilianensis]GGF68721.1 hypothetical protein GCM10011375_24710 [Hymenobacter qilianensis]